MSNPEDQHYVPRIYLKGFTKIVKDKEEIFYQLKGIEIPGKKSLKFYINDSNPSKVCYIKNLYTINTKGAKERIKSDNPYIVETKAFPYEKEFLKDLHNFITYKTQLLPPLTADKMIKTILHIKLRNPANKNFIENSNFTVGVTIKTGQKFKEKYPYLKLGKKLEKMVFDELNIPGAKSDLYNEMLMLSPENKKSASTTIKKEMLKRIFYVFYTPSALPFFTSCNPGFFIQNNNHLSSMGAKGAIYFVFPLTPTRLFVIDFRKYDSNPNTNYKQIFYVKANKDFVDSINLATFNLSGDYKVFSFDKKYLVHLRDMLENDPELCASPSTEKTQEPQNNKNDHIE